MKQWDIQLSILTPDEVDYDEVLEELQNYSSEKINDIEIINGFVDGYLEDEWLK